MTAAADTGYPSADCRKECDAIYGFPAGVLNPHDFSPDDESCTPKEIAAWKEACAAFDAGQVVKNDSGCNWIGDSVSVLKAPWGIGVYTIHADDCPNLVTESRR